MYYHFKFNLCKYNPGAYVPLTLEGKIIVDGTLVSCYASRHHDLVHIAMTPIQWFPNIIEWMIGEKNGLPIFVTIAEDVGRWLPDDEVSSG